MYSNALRKNPLFQPKIAHKQGREDFSVGTVTKPCSFDSVPSQVHRTKYASQRKGIHATTQLTVEKHNTPRLYELDATLLYKKFDTVDKNRGTRHETNGERSVGRVYSVPSIIQNNVVVETNKPRIIKEHVGASTDYPSSKIGEALLKQKALSSLTTFPESFAKLNGKLSELLSIGSPPVPTKPEAEPAPAPAPSATAATVPSPKSPRSPRLTTPPPLTIPPTKSPSTPPEPETKVDNTIYHDSIGDMKGYETILRRLNRLKSRMSRNPTSDVASDTLDYLRELDIISVHDTENSTIIQKVDTSISQIEGYIAEINAPPVPPKVADV